MNRTAQTYDVNLSGFVFAERRDLKVGVEDQARRAAVPHKYFAGAEIGVDIGAGGKRIQLAAIDVPTRHRTTPAGMIVFEQRRHVIARHTGGRTWIGAPRTLKDPPSVIASESDDVNLFDNILSDIAGVKHSRGAVERTAEWVAKPGGIDFIASRRRAEEWIGRRRDVRRGPVCIHINAQHLPQQLVVILRAVAGVIRAAAVAHPDVQESIRAEIDPSAVVIGERLWDGDDYSLFSFGHVRIAG